MMLREHEVDLMNLFASAGSTFEVPLSLLCYGSYHVLSLVYLYDLYGLAPMCENSAETLLRGFRT